MLSFSRMGKMRDVAFFFAANSIRRPRPINVKQVVTDSVAVSVIVPKIDLRTVHGRKTAGTVTAYSRLARL